MRIVFFGTPDAAVPSLKALAGSPHEIVLVVTQPDRPAKRGRRLHAPPVKRSALELGLPVEQPESIGARAFRERLVALRPDALVVVAFGRIFGPKLLGLAPHGAINLHFSLLPRWRGAAPVQRALLAGDEVTGVSVMRLVRELDAGPVHAQRDVAIEPGEHAARLEARLADVGAGLLREVLDAFETRAGTGAEMLEPVEQDEAAATLAPPLRKEEGDLDPSRPAEDLVRRVRALDPWPGARLPCPGGPVRVLEARVGEACEAAPGVVLAPEGDALAVACGDGLRFEALRVRPPGRRDMPGRSLVDGRLVTVGCRLVVSSGEAS